VHVSNPWLADHTEGYQAFCKLWASEEFIAKSNWARQCRGNSEGHTYGPNGHMHLSKCSVRKICMKIHSEYIYATNSYPQKCETGEWPPDVKVWKRGHWGPDPSQPDQLCTLLAQAQPVSC
jgi:hypothetical protein